jgi:ankyrin repeat protein
MEYVNLDGHDPDYKSEIAESDHTDTLNYVDNWAENNDYGKIMDIYDRDIIVTNFNLGNGVLTPVDFDEKYNKIRELLETGIDVHCLSKYLNETVLHTAVNRSDIRLCRLLLEYKADVNREGTNHETALYCTGNNTEDIIITQMLLDNGSNINKQNCQNETALHLASGNVYDMKVRMLLEYGADVNLLDICRKTALHRVVMFKARYYDGSTSEDRNDRRSQIMRLLLERDSSQIDKQCNLGRTAIFLAANNGYDKCVRVLLDYGANTYLSGNADIIIDEQDSHMDKDALQVAKTPEIANMIQAHRFKLAMMPIMLHLADKHVAGLELRVLSKVKDYWCDKK